MPVAWDTEMALAIKNTARKAAKSLPNGWYRAEVLQVTPKLIFSVVSKEFQFSTGDGLIMTATAKSKTWKVGMQAAAILQGSELLVLDSL